MVTMGSKPTSDAAQHPLVLGLSWRHDRPKPAFHADRQCRIATSPKRPFMQAAAFWAAQGLQRGTLQSLPALKSTTGLQTR
jgi:hypothetical protein